MGRADPEPVEHDDGGAARHRGWVPVWTKRKRSVVSDLVEQLLLVWLEVTRGLLLQHAEGVDQGLAHLARIGGAESLRARRELPAQGACRPAGRGRGRAT